MEKQPLFLKPVFQERIWGGTALKDIFGYDIPSNKTGECWAISAHPNGMGIIMNGEYEGQTLKELWDNHRELFGNVEGEQFPLLTKILDADDDLSVQVHPDDKYAFINENGELGKTECWYIIDCKEEAEMVFGHNAQTKEEMEEMIKKGEWNEFLRRVKIKPGDFFNVPSGSVHALCKGTLVLETQQSSDTTYRLYDYDRRDDQGNTRELHLQKSMDVITVPHEEEKLENKVQNLAGAVITTYVENEFFSVYKYTIHSSETFKQEKPFLMMSVLEGSGMLNGYSIKKGDHFILPAGFGDFTIKGELELMVASI